MTAIVSDEGLGCEHNCGALCAPGARFCSDWCRECESTDAPDGLECAGVCFGPDSEVSVFRRVPA